MNNIEIIPAIMPNSYNDLLEKSGQVSDVVSIVQIDVMDGIFVPEKTWPYVDSADEHFARMINEEEGLPNAEKIDYELDLMIQSPDTDFDKWVALQPRRIIVHIESLENPENFFAKVQPLRDIIQIGVSLNNDTDISVIQPYLGQVDFVQCMGIARIGYQGESFDERVLETILNIKKIAPDMVVSVDGAVNAETAKKLVDAGAIRLVSGSAIFGGENVEEGIARLRKSI